MYRHNNLNKGKQLNITILSVNVETKPTAKGSYQVADVAYKNNSFQGKVEGKKVMSFGAAASSFRTLATAQQGETYEVTIVKNDKGYNDWVNMAKAEANTTPDVPKGSVAPASTPTRSTYETPEERAQRQVLIVRQSSVSSAVAMLCAGAKQPPSVDAVLSLASALENHVFGVKDPGPSGFDDFPDMLPELN